VGTQGSVNIRWVIVTISFSTAAVAGGSVSVVVIWWFSSLVRVSIFSCLSVVIFAVWLTRLVVGIVVVFDGVGSMLCCVVVDEFGGRECAGIGVTIDKVWLIVNVGIFVVIVVVVVVALALLDSVIKFMPPVDVENVAGNVVAEGICVVWFVWNLLLFVVEPLMDTKLGV
jgi:hypothetical protein